MRPGDATSTKGSFAGGGMQWLTDVAVDPREQRLGRRPLDGLS